MKKRRERGKPSNIPDTITYSCTGRQAQSVFLFYFFASMRGFFLSYVLYLSFLFLITMDFFWLNGRKMSKTGGNIEENLLKDKIILCEENNKPCYTFNDTRTLYAV